VLLAIGGGAATLLDPSTDETPRGPTGSGQPACWCRGCVGLLASQLGLWRWRLGRMASATGMRRQAAAVVHLARLAAGAVDGVALAAAAEQPPRRPAAVVRGGGVASTLLTPSSDRSLLLGLPALAALAAFALPTLKRSVAALIDWFTLLFFTGCAW
jgi:hypothetical protein